MARRATRRLDPNVEAAVIAILEIEDLPWDFVQVLERLGSRVRLTPAEANPEAALRRLAEALDEWRGDTEPRRRPNAPPTPPPSPRGPHPSGPDEDRLAW